MDRNTRHRHGLIQNHARDECRCYLHLPALVPRGHSDTSDTACASATRLRRSRTGVGDSECMALNNLASRAPSRPDHTRTDNVLLRAVRGPLVAKARFFADSASKIKVSTLARSFARWRCIVRSNKHTHLPLFFVLYAYSVLFQGTSRTSESSPSTF